MYYILRKKSKISGISACVLVLLMISARSFAQRQLHMPDHDEKKFYLGIGLLYNNSRFQLSQHPRFLQYDSILAVNPENTGGFGIAGMFTYRLSKRFEIRGSFPQFMFSYKNITYNLKYPDNTKDEQPVMTKRVESILAGFPVHLKFRSDRIENFRVYMFGGGKIEYDLASTARARRAEELVKLRGFDYGVEAGIGFNFYFPVFILSPEIKISNGLGNSHSRDEYLKYSNVIDRLQSRMVVFSLIFEG